jgi:nitrile hydratase
MDGIHDLGGMDGMGPVGREEDEPIFHEEWEGRVFAMQFANSEYNVDEFRHAIERMDPAYYLGSSYYEHWLVAMEKLFTEKGTVDVDELCERIDALSTARDFDDDLPERYDSDVVEAMRAALENRLSKRDESVTPAFEAGDDVVVKNIHPEGHTRCPRYVRRAQGTVTRVDGGFSLPDASPHSEGGIVEPVYHVRFDAAELWGDDAEGNNAVYVDLWESYLEAP